MKIKAIIFPPLRDIIGSKYLGLNIQQYNIKGLIEDLTKSYPAIKQELYNKDGSLAYQVWLNGKPIARSKGLDTPLKEGDEAAFLMALSGG